LIQKIVFNLSPTSSGRFYLYLQEPLGPPETEPRRGGINFATAALLAKNRARQKSFLFILPVQAEALARAGKTKLVVCKTENKKKIFSSYLFTEIRQNFRFFVLFKPLKSNSPSNEFDFLYSFVYIKSVVKTAPRGVLKLTKIKCH